MFISAGKRQKNGKKHTYHRVMEKQRSALGQWVQRQVIYLGELTSDQEASWRRALQVFDRDGVEVKLSQDPQELWVLARSDGRQDKEMAIRRRKLRRLFQGLLALRRSLPKRDQLLQRMGVLRHEAGRAAALVCTHGHLTDAYAATRCGSDASRGTGATCGDKDDRCASSGQ